MSELYRIRIMSNWDDTMDYGGMIISYTNEVFSYHSPDNDDVVNNWDDCCSWWKYIDQSVSCPCK